MSEVNEIECSVCGRDLEDRPPAGCDICHGGAEVRPRAYTLSTVRAGKAPKENRYEDLAPKASPLVVGGHISHPGNR